MKVRIRPLKGQVLIQVLPRETQTETGIELPDIAFDPDRGEKQKPFKGRVVAMGKWKETKQGFGILPDFGVGSVVLCNPYAGTKLARTLQDLLLVSFEDVIAKVEGVV